VGKYSYKTEFSAEVAGKCQEAAKGPKRPYLTITGGQTKKCTSKEKKSREGNPFLLHCVAQIEKGFGQPVAPARRAGPAFITKGSGQSQKGHWKLYFSTMRPGRRGWILHLLSSNVSLLRKEKRERVHPTQEGATERPFTI